MGQMDRVTGRTLSGEGVEDLMSRVGNFLGHKEFAQAAKEIASRQSTEPLLDGGWLERLGTLENAEQQQEAIRMAGQVLGYILETRCSLVLTQNLDVLADNRGSLNMQVVNDMIAETMAVVLHSLREGTLASGEDGPCVLANRALDKARYGETSIEIALDRLRKPDLENHQPMLLTRVGEGAETQSVASALAALVENAFARLELGAATPDSARQIGDLLLTVREQAEALLHVAVIVGPELGSYSRQLCDLLWERYTGPGITNYDANKDLRAQGSIGVLSRAIEQARRAAGETGSDHNESLGKWRNDGESAWSRLSIATAEAPKIAAIIARQLKGKRAAEVSALLGQSGLHSAAEINFTDPALVLGIARAIDKPWVAGIIRRTLGKS